MASFPSYDLDALLYDSAITAVYRARCACDQHPVVLKVPRDPAPERLAAFKREYDVLCTLNLPGVVRAYGLEHEADAWIMVLEDFGGGSLARLQLAGRLAIADFLQLALAVMESLRQVHQQYVMHKHVTPGNIGLNPATGAVKLIDIGMASVLSRETRAFRNSSVLEGTLAYLAPEQTGRMHRAMDKRADFYAPDLEGIIGPQPAVVDVPPAEASNRFSLVVHNFSVHGGIRAEAVWPGGAPGNAASGPGGLKRGRQGEGESGM